VKKRSVHSYLGRNAYTSDACAYKQDTQCLQAVNAEQKTIRQFKFLMNVGNDDPDIFVVAVPVAVNTVGLMCQGDFF
jgi:DNA-binding IclR family transcriptional regulator